MKKMSEHSDSRLYSICNVKGGKSSLTIFQHEWEDFCNIMNEQIRTWNSVKNIIFYRANHGMLMTLDNFKHYLERCFKKDESVDDIVLVQVHVGLRIIPREGEGLFVKRETVLEMHANAGVSKKTVNFYHPFLLSLKYGHYR